MSDYKDMTTEELGKMLANARSIVLNISQEIGNREPKPVEIPHYKLVIYRDDESSDGDSLVTASSVMHFGVICYQGYRMHLSHRVEWECMLMDVKDMRQRYLINHDELMAQIHNVNVIDIKELTKQFYQNLADIDVEIANINERINASDVGASDMLKRFHDNRMVSLIRMFKKNWVPNVTVVR